MDSGLQILDSGFFICGTWISDSNRWWDSDSLSCIRDSTFQSPGFPIFQKQKFPIFRIVLCEVTKQITGHFNSVVDAFKPVSCVEKKNIGIIT